MGAGMNMGAQHSQTIYAMLTAMPGLKVVVPSNAYDAKGLLIQAIRDDDPVMFFEHKALYPRKGEVPDGAYTIPFGEANLLREGEHVTVVAIGAWCVFAEKAVDKLAKEGISCDLIDPRTTSPLDEETILDSVENTGRLVVVDESNPRCSVASDICAIVAAEGLPVARRRRPRIGHRAAYARAVRARARTRLCAGPRPDRSGHPRSDGGVEKRAATIPRLTQLRRSRARHAARRPRRLRSGYGSGSEDGLACRRSDVPEQGAECDTSRRRSRYSRRIARNVISARSRARRTSSSCR